MRVLLFIHSSFSHFTDFSSPSSSVKIVPWSARKETSSLFFDAQDGDMRILKGKKKGSFGKCIFIKMYDDGYSGIFPLIFRI